MRQITIPSSKSHTIRALYFSLFSSKTCKIDNYLDCNDTDAMIEAMQSFGVTVEKKKSSLEVPANKLFKIPNEPIDAKNSGLIFRFMTAFSALFKHEITIIGDESIQKRRIIHPLVQALRQGKVKTEFLNPPNHAPLLIQGPLNPSRFTLQGYDSQPVSALLMTLVFLKKKSVVYVNNPQECSWIDLTLFWLKKMGAKIENEQYKKYTIFPLTKLDGFHVTLSADYSSATYPMTYAILKGVALKIQGLQWADPHPDRAFFEILNKMGANVDWLEGYCGKKIILLGGTFNINNCIDTLPLFCLLGCFCLNPLKLTGAGICKYKESNRIEAASCELIKMGAKIYTHDDGCTIFASKLKPHLTSSYKDHRIAMTLFVANKLIGSKLPIDDMVCIDKSYPDFLKDMSTL